MKISHNWLNQFIHIPITPQETAEILTDIGLEVEKLEKVEAIKGGLNGLIVGEIVSLEQHPNADKLKLTKVDIGEEAPLSIVCGAPNVAKGQKVIVATVGTTLYPTDGDSFKIKKSKIRGEESFGMLCAEDEIGLGKSHAGITILDEKTKVGTAVKDYYNLSDDWVYEIGLTPNRADAMSHLGVARDLVVAFKHKGIITPETQMCQPSVDSFKVDNENLTIPIEIKNANACPRYAGVTISEITIQESPDWLKKRLLAIGLNPINNVVDATNYVLHELGQPLHAFDVDKIEGNVVIVDTAKDKESFITLDETKRELTSNDLMIKNQHTSMCIAGVFGGLTSGVTAGTKNIFLESAYFDPVYVRKTAKSQGLNTDASFRFERGIDPNITIYALKRAALLIKEIAGGTISSNIQEFYPTPITDFTVSFNIENCYRLIGKNIGEENILNILHLLDIKVTSRNQNQLELLVPPFRNDVTREADIIEEVLRIYGFNQIDIPEKLNTSISYSSKINKENISNKTADFLSAQGYLEMMANSLTKSSYSHNKATGLNPEHNVALLNPLSSDLDVLRQTLIFNGLEAIAYNKNRQQNDLKLFEFGKTYHKFSEGFEENEHLTLFLAGQSNSENWNTEKKSKDFYAIKIDVFKDLNKLGILKNEKINETKSSFFSYGLSISINKKKVVDFGLISSNLSTDFGIKDEVFCANFNWTNILELSIINRIKYKPLSKYPSSRRDLSLLIDDTISFENIKEIAQKVDRKVLRDVGLFDIYKGKNLEKGKKSYAVSFLFRDDEKTIQDKQIDKIMSKIQEELTNKLKASLR